MYIVKLTLRSPTSLKYRTARAFSTQTRLEMAKGPIGQRIAYSQGDIILCCCGTADDPGLLHPRRSSSPVFTETMLTTGKLARS